MSAIAGWLDCGPPTRARRACEQILAALAQFGPQARDCRELGDACFGRALFKTLPEDDFDSQPLIGGGGRYLLTADVRIDNRAELAAELGIPAAVLKRSSDAGLLLIAWERWQLQCVDRLLGDFAFAVWDSIDQRLTLVRGPLSQKSLFYHRGRGFIAFASMPQALHAVSQIPKSLELDEAVAIAAGASQNGPATIFSGIPRLKQGHAVEFSGDRERLIRLWDLERAVPQSGTIEQLGEAMRSELDRAVAAQLRRRGGNVACQLSSGRDSSAVAVTAALALKSAGEPLLAFTGAPRAGFSDGSGGNYLCDESELAGLTASAHENMIHHVCRPDGTMPVPQFDRLHWLHFGPMLNPSNMPWWTQINREASAKGSSILLTGATGNFSISAGGSHYLADLWSERGVIDWWRRARRLGGGSWTRWRNIASVSFGSLLPRPLYDLLLSSSGRNVRSHIRMPLLRPPYRGQAEALLERRFHDRRPPRNYFDFRREMIFWIDNAEKLSLAAWGLDVRDPTADRRLVELCFSFPAEQLASTNSTRPIYEAAFGERIPREVLTNPRRGYQTADWFEIFREENIREAFRAYRRHPLIEDLVDFQEVDRMLDAWPSGGWHRDPIIDAYRNKLLGALALADFIAIHFPA